jgi:hypothetical protein
MQQIMGRQIMGRHSVVPFAWLLVPWSQNVE